MCLNRCSQVALRALGEGAGLLPLKRRSHLSRHAERREIADAPIRAKIGAEGRRNIDEIPSLHEQRVSIGGSASVQRVSASGFGARAVWAEARTLMK